jgi:hypothetical protein
MELTKACSNILSQLTDLVSQIHEQDFVRPAEALSNSTIGQHLRHTLEFFLCLQQGVENGTINYDKRAHDRVIETDKNVALLVINQINEFINTLPEKPLRLEVGYDLVNHHYLTIDTTASRELVYNIEHAVHHMAIIKIGVRELAGYIRLAPDFGIAASTIRYKEAPSLIAY